MIQTFAFYLFATIVILFMFGMTYVAAALYNGL